MQHRLNHRHLTIAGIIAAAACAGPTVVMVPAPLSPPPPVPSTPSGLAAMALAGMTPEVPAGVVVKDDTVRYPVRGADVLEIGGQLGVARGNSDSDYIGATATRVQWQFAQLPVDDTCAISDVMVTLSIETRLPEWVHPARVSETLTRQWATFLDATQQHENGHRNIALQTAAAMARSLASEHGLPCAELDQLANASAQAQWDLGHQHQLAYDAATRHGETQGSRWPPFVGDQ